MKTLETQIGGDHYKGIKIQPIEYALENGLGICEHAVLKYITRWRDKGGIPDLEKAIHYLQILIEHEQGKEKEPEKDVYLESLKVYNRLAIEKSRKKNGK